jgi:hypothetical protein
VSRWALPFWIQAIGYPPLAVNSFVQTERTHLRSADGAHWPASGVVRLIDASVYSCAPFQAYRRIVRGALSSAHLVQTPEVILALRFSSK